MRFAIPPFAARGRIAARDPREWPLSVHFAVMIIPFGICIALAATWIGYEAASSALRDSLNAVPLLEAKMQANKMEESLRQLRRGLVSIAEYGDITEDFLIKSLRLHFHENTDLVQEIGFRDAQQNGFLLLRDNHTFTRLSAAEASHGLYSPFQQLGTLPLHPGQVTLYPPVYFDDPAQVSQTRPVRTPVMRLALMLPDQSGTLVLGISLADLCKALSAFLQPGSSLRLPSQEGLLRMSFFFDPRGWILFETSSIGSGSFLPDLSREGYLGDLGRPGYDAAFRPWAAHENFWRMVTEVQSGLAGSISATGDKYFSGNSGATGLLCFAPVVFAPSEDAPPAVQGGIAFFETSTLPLAAFLRFANFSIGVMVGAIVLAAALAFWVNKRLGVPLRRMAKDLSTMADSGELAFLNIDHVSEEQHHFQSAVNGIIAGAMNARNQFERLNREVEHSRSRLPVDLHQGRKASPAGEFGLIGSSALIREMREHVHKAARAGTDVLIWGETGTGKELAAAAIHKASSRNNGPYVSINCGALDENLLLDTLFGHAKGAFTEARNDRKGAFLAAQGGTLHLDEVANASPKVQQALLRALSVRRIRPLGTDEEIAFDTRVVAATNVDLRACVRAGSFREDLYYRLSIINIETPPLRHHKEDIPELAAHCIHDAALALGRPEARLSRGAFDLMYAYDWPGNVREFKNCLTRAMAFVEDDLILVQHITLEQGACGTYAKPPFLRPPVDARQHGRPETMVAGDSGAQPPAKGYFRRTDIAAGSSQVAESLFPSPPRENFTPARPGHAQAADLATSTLNGDERAVPQTASSTQAQAARSTGAAVSPEYRAMAEAGPLYPAHPPMPPVGYPAEETPGSLPKPAPAGRHAASAPAGPQRFAVHGVPERLPPPFNAKMPPPNALSFPSSFDGLNERQLRALDFAREHGRISRPQFGEVAGADVSARTLQNDLRELVERGILKRIGAGPATCYELGDIS